MLACVVLLGACTPAVVRETKPQMTVDNATTGQLTVYQGGGAEPIVVARVAAGERSVLYLPFGPDSCTTFALTAVAGDGTQIVRPKVCNDETWTIRAGDLHTSPGSSPSVSS